MSEKMATDRNCVMKIQEQKNHLSQSLRVLVIDDNIVCLRVLAFNLQKCGYRVSTTRDAREAIEMLKKNKDSYDVVLTDVVRSDVDGFQIVKIIGYEIGIPVIMTSANSDIEIIEKGVRHGALDYLVKPVRVEILRNIWQHVVRKSMCFSKGVRRIEEDVGANTNKNNAMVKDDTQSTCSTGGNENSKKRARAEWTHELRVKFADVVRRLEVHDKVVPKNILKMMNEPNLTRQQVASYLQKYRINEEQQSIESRDKLRNLSETNVMYSLSPNIAPFTSAYAQSQPLRHQTLRPSQYSDPNMIMRQCIPSQGNSSHVSYNQMEIRPQALNLPSRFGAFTPSAIKSDSLTSAFTPSSGVDGGSSYFDRQNNVGVKLERPYASYSNLVGNGHQVVGGFTSQRASVIQPDTNVGSTQSKIGQVGGFRTQRASIIQPDNNVGSIQTKIEQVLPAEVHPPVCNNVGTTPYYLPVSYEEVTPLAIVDPGQIQAPEENVTFKSEGNIANVSDSANIFYDDDLIFPCDDDINAMMQILEDPAPHCDNIMSWD